MHSCTVISFYRVAAGATCVMSSIWWPFLGANGSSAPNLSDVGCFNSSQNTVLIGSEFEGVPVVLLLNFIAFLVGARKLRLFPWNATKTWCHRSWVDGFLLPVPPTGFAQPLLHNKEELLGLRTTGASCWQWRVSSGFLSPQRSLETIIDRKWQWHYFYWFIYLFGQVLNSELCISGSLSQHAVATDAYQPLWMIPSMNWYVSHGHT